MDHEKPKLEIAVKSIAIRGLDSLPPRQFLLRRLNLERGMLVSLVGTGNSGKTMFAQYLAVCIANQLPLFGTYQAEGSRLLVLHIDQEQSESLTQRRYERLGAGLSLGQQSLGIDRAKLFFTIDDPQLPIEETLVKFFNPYSLVIIDSLRQIIACDENNSQIGHHLNLLKRVAEKTGTVIIVIHHKGKNLGTSKQSGRGSSAIYDQVDVQIDLDATDSVIELSCAKNRDGIYWKGMSYTISDEGFYNEAQSCTEKLYLSLSQEDLPIRQEKKQIQILRMLTDRSEVKHQYLVEQIGGSKSDLKQLIADMVQQKLIVERRGPKNARIFSMGPNGKTKLDYAEGVEK